MTIGGPCPNYYGGDRPGDNLFGNSIVAVDGDTGKYKWHFQTIHHDLWDWDLPAPPVLFDVTATASAMPALAETGKPADVHPRPRDRRADPRGRGAAGRRGRRARRVVQPTQPFPVKPPSARSNELQLRRPGDGGGHTPTHAANCRALYEKSGGFYNAGPFTPFLYHEEGTPPGRRSSFRVRRAAPTGAAWPPISNVGMCSSTRRTRVRWAGSKKRSRA